MARNEKLTIFHANTVDENQRLLEKLQTKSQVRNKNQEDLTKLFNTLNHNCQLKSTKEDGYLNSCWYNKKVASYTYGPIPGFPSGSWWGIRMDCSRNRVHDPFDRDVQNGPFGVTSVCTSNDNTNEDVDFGESLTLTGQKYVNGRMEKDPLVKNVESGIPVRLIRSYNLLNEFAPKTGYRYDGLYAVADYWIVKNTDGTKFYKFALLRLKDQERPAWNGSKARFGVKCVPVAKNTSEDLSPGAYEFKKYSHSDSFKTRRKSERNERVQDKGKERKDTTESAIVTRHVFKKIISNQENATAAGTSDSSTLSQIGTQACKAHSTNISIRTGLYDSSHSLHHEIKKTSLLPFNRTAKPVNILNTNLHMENCSVSNREKSKDVSKVSSSVSRVSNDAKEKIEINVSTESTKPVDQNFVATTKPESTKVNESISESGDKKCALRLTQFHVDKTAGPKENDETREKTKSTVNPAETIVDATSNVRNRSEESEILTYQVVSEQLGNISIGNESSCIQGLKSLDSLDSLTPDKILNLISNEKYHPISKLLMGNMIGLTTEQSIMLKTRRLLSETEVTPIAKKSEADESVEKKSFKAASEELSAGRCYKFRRRKKLLRKIVNKSDVVGVYDEMKSDATLKKESFDILGKMPGKTYERRNARRTLKSKIFSDEPTEKAVESKTEVRTSRLRPLIKKHMQKKQRREIANLSIDAKIAPKIRGPRNRRLRSINTKRSYEPFSTLICTLNKCTVNSGERTAFKTLGQAKRLRTKQSANVKRSSSLNRHRHNDLGISVNEKYQKLPDLQRERISSAEKIEHRNILSNKKKYTVPRGNSVKRQQREDRKKEVEKPCTTDAVTQCCLIKEPLSKNSKAARNSVETSRQTIPKVESSAKSEMFKTIDQHRQEQSHSNCSCSQKRKDCTKYCNVDYPGASRNSCPEGREETVIERVSAFVPVNVVDSDLRIARLRSIGFKPIICCATTSEQQSDRQKKKECAIAYSSKVMKQDVAEKYNKYTNEENNVVIYMDDELQYQDIEAEDEGSSKAKKPKISKRNEQRETGSGSTLNKDVETPWHGWKKVVTDNRSYWIGW